MPCSTVQRRVKSSGVVRRFRHPESRIKISFTDQWRQSHGFTLLEILLVLLIFSLAVTIASLSVTSGLNKIRHKTAAKRISTMFAYARNLAIAERRVYYTEVIAGRVVVAAVNSDNIKKALLLPDGLEVESTQGSTILFYPGGSSSGGVFKVLDRKGAALFILRIDPSTGKVYETASSL